MRHRRDNLPTHWISASPHALALHSRSSPHARGALVRLLSCLLMLGSLAARSCRLARAERSPAPPCTPSDGRSRSCVRRCSSCTSAAAAACRELVEVCMARESATGGRPDDGVLVDVCSEHVCSLIGLVSSVLVEVCSERVAAAGSCGLAGARLLVDVCRERASRTGCCCCCCDCPCVQHVMAKPTRTA